MSEKRFVYSALDRQGRLEQGAEQGTNRAEIHAKLRAAGLMPLHVVRKGGLLPAILTRAPNGFSATKRWSGVRLGSSDKASMLERLAVLSEAGLPIAEAVAALLEQTPMRREERVLLELQARIDEGFLFSQAMAAMPGVFDSIEASIIAAGEKNGRLGVCLRRLADMMARMNAFRRAIAGAVLYPACVSLILGFVIYFLLTQVVPPMVEQLQSMDAAVPGLTRTILAIAEMLRLHGSTMLLMVLILSATLSVCVRLRRFRLWLDACILALPIYGRLLGAFEAARFSRCLTTILSSGTPLDTALHEATGVVKNASLRKRLHGATCALEEGESLHQALRRYKALPAMMVTMIAAGERAGDISRMLEKNADHAQERFEMMTQTALRAIEPLLLLLLGGIIFVIILAVFLPIFSLNRSFLS